MPNRSTDVGSQDDQWSLSRIEWQVSWKGQTLCVRLWDAQGWERREQCRMWKDMALYGGPLSWTETADAPLIFSSRPTPVPVMPLQLREQSSYRLDVRWLGQARATDITCFPLLEPPILRTDPGQTDNKQIFSGSLHFRDYAGETVLSLWDGTQEIFRICLEVRSRKLSYLDDYVALLDDLGSRLAGLLLQLDSPVSAAFWPEPGQEEPVGDELVLLLRHIVRSPTLREAWEIWHQSKSTDLRREKHITRIDRDVPDSSQEWLFGYQRDNVWLPAPTSWTLPAYTKQQVPLYYPKDGLFFSEDTPENRFVYRLMARVMDALEELYGQYQQAGRWSLAQDILQLQEEWSDITRYPFYSSRRTPSFGCPFLPVPEYRLASHSLYRPFWKAWNVLSAALRLSWQELAETLRGPLRDLAHLYEYWCFFALAEALSDVCQQPLSSSWWIWDKQRLCVGLQRGKPFVFSYKQLRLALFYQKRFVAGEGHFQSYSVPLVPDYTLEVYHPEHPPVLLCFDAKYRPERALEKMHAYRDALRGAVGCYLFYPGDDPIPTIFTKHPTLLLPGVGAFSLRPHPESRDWLSRWLRWALEQLSEDVEKAKTSSHRTRQQQPTNP